jgi:putative acetyltransferase
MAPLPPGIIDASGQCRGPSDAVAALIARPCDLEEVTSLSASGPENRVRAGRRGSYHPGMDLREELPGDREPVRDIHLRAFGSHGRSDHALVVADLVDSLRQSITPTAGLSLVAELDGRVVGHAMFTRSLLDAPRRLVEVHVLSPLAVTPDCQRRGVGSALVRQGLKALAERAVPLVFLEGDPRYYLRLGFAPGGDVGFRKPSLRIPDAAFQVIKLPGYEPWMTGTLVYAEPFWRHDLVGRRDPSA